MNKLFIIFILISGTIYNNEIKDSGTKFKVYFLIICIQSKNNNWAWAKKLGTHV